MNTEAQRVVAESIEPPNYTQMPNLILDHFLPYIDTLAELKVILVIARQTFGYHRKSDQLSLSQLTEKTGLARASVVEGVKAAMARGLLLRKARGQSFSYALNMSHKVVQNLNQFRNQTSSDIEPAPVQILNQFNRESSSDSEHTKESTKESTKERYCDESQRAPDALLLDSDSIRTKPSKSKPGHNRKAAFVHGSLVAADNPLLQAVYRALQINAAATDMRRQIGEETAAALLADNRTAEEVDRFTANWWKHSFFGTTHKRKPKPDELRNDFDEVLNLHKDNPNERLDRSQRNARATASDLRGIAELEAIVRDMENAENGIRALPEYAAPVRS